MERRGLVLAGGGARGAYEAGVLHYLFMDAPAELREMAHFEILCGTSVGAINTSALAASLHDIETGLGRLIEVWRGLELGDLLPLRMRDLAMLPGWLLAGLHRESLVPSDAVMRIIDRSIDWTLIDQNFKAGLLEALSVSATQVRTGKTVVFYQTPDLAWLPWSTDPHVRARPTRIRGTHARASSAIPFIFPSVNIDGQAYLDGGLRQNTPLSPALRLGATRILVVDLRHDRRPKRGPWYDRPLEVQTHRPLFLLGKVLNALMLDHIDYDLIRLQRFNDILLDGEREFGARFLERLTKVIEPVRGAGYRLVPHIVLRPSNDLGVLAAQHVRSRKFRSQHTMAAHLMRVLARGELYEEADLTSYLLFDGQFAETLINLGIEDAATRRDDLLRFFSGEKCI